MIGTVLAMICKEEKQSMRALRAVKTLFFLVSMLISLLVFSAPVLLLIADALLPAALLSATFPPHSPLSLSLFSDRLASYQFHLSLIDIPLLSLARSAVIIFVYSLCDGPRLSRGPYLGTTTVCSLSSLVFLSVKASYFFNPATLSDDSTGCRRAVEVALFVCSAALAVGHTVVAYRISCRERRKLLVYKIDIEAVVSKNGFPIRYSKLLQLERMR
uniref:MENTAL domain-containing protein n=1 Tax=Kalanchoe fedtschenkoi TaxID=63787 RepID=A0A7N0THW0_KALFE